MISQKKQKQQTSLTCSLTRHVLIDRQDNTVISEEETCLYLVNIRKNMFEEKSVCFFTPGQCMFYAIKYNCFIRCGLFENCWLSQTIIIILCRFFSEQKPNAQKNMFMNKIVRLFTSVKRIFNAIKCDCFFRFGIFEVFLRSACFPLQYLYLVIFEQKP